MGNIMATEQDWHCCKKQLVPLAGSQATSARTSTYICDRRNPKKLKYNNQPGQAKSNKARARATTGPAPSTVHCKIAERIRVQQAVILVDRNKSHNL